VINVDRRMSYTSVHAIVELQDPEERKEYEELIPMFELMYELASILRKRRDKRGSIDFDFPESKITLDSKGKPIDVAEYERNNAHRIIEEFGGKSDRCGRLLLAGTSFCVSYTRST
jgi:ribonuclease R